MGLIPFLATRKLAIQRDFSIAVGRSTIQVLVVDDYAPWRRLVCSMLRKWTDLRLADEVSDGLEAVQKAQALQPDLILMDIGLPKLNGIEAARRIRKLSVNSKILCVSACCDLDIIEEAFRSGISGYVLKSAASTQLFPALEAVIQGKRFLCPCLGRQDVNHPLLRLW